MSETLRSSEQFDEQRRDKLGLLSALAVHSHGHRSKELIDGWRTLGLNAGATTKVTVTYREQDDGIVTAEIQTTTVNNPTNHIKFPEDTSPPVVTRGVPGVDVQPVPAGPEADQVLDDAILYLDQAATDKAV